MKKERIIEEIKRTASENGGGPLGQRTFTAATGITAASWLGRYWRNWSDALVEAGFEPNRPLEAHTDELLIQSMAKLTRQLRRFPTVADMRLERRTNDAFPSHSSFQKLGSKPARIELVRNYARQREDFSDVLSFLPTSDENEADEVGESDNIGADGYVYLLKSGKHYKIGKSFSVPRRHREIALELPEKPDAIHVISTDDPAGIEAYWHKRFAAKHTNGEWFALSPRDVRAFKRRRKFM